MKVVHVCCVAPPEAGGMGAVAYQEVSRLRKLGVDAVLVAPSVIPAKAGIQKENRMDPRVSSDSPKDDNIVIRLPAVRIGNVARMFGLDKIVKDADVVHLHYPFYFTSGLIARWRRQNKIKKLVITLHMDATDKGWRWLAAYLHRKLFQKRLLDSADVLLVSTLDYAQNSSFAPWVKTSKLHELPFGVDTEAFKSVRHAEFISASQRLGSDRGETLKQVQGDGKDGKLVGMVGVMDRAHPFKGVDVFLRALAKLPNNVQGLLVGDGDRRKDYELLAKELGISERTKFVGRLDRDKLIEAFQSMDVFAFPSTSRAEAFGLVLLEAMACGVPVIASDLPGVRAVAKDAGLIVPINDPEALAAGLRRMLEDQAWRQSLTLAAREKAERFGWQNHVTKLTEFYGEIPPAPLIEGGVTSL